MKKKDKENSKAKRNSAIEKVEEIAAFSGENGTLGSGTVGLNGVGGYNAANGNIGTPFGDNQFLGGIFVPDFEFGEDKPSAYEMEKAEIEARGEREKRENAAIKKAMKEQRRKGVEEAEKVSSEDIKKAYKKAREVKKEEIKKMKAEKKEAKLAEKRRKEEAKDDEEFRRAFEDGNGKKRRTRGGNGGYIAAIAALSAAVLVLISALATTLMTDRVDLGQPAAHSADAQRAYYDFVGYVDNIETNMSKLFVSCDTSGQQKILGDIAVQSNLADASLSQLPMRDEAKFLTSKHINQVGDYAKYLNNRLIDGNSLTDEDYGRLNDLYRANAQIKRSLSELSADINEGYDFKSIANGFDGDMITDRFTGMEEQAKDYPEMIYDGPFSDGLEGMKVKGLEGLDEVDEKAVLGRFEELFSAYGYDSPKVVGKSLNGRIETYNVRSDIEGGEIYAQFSAKGGKLILFNAFNDCTEDNYGEEECLATAKTFLENAGFENMTSVWSYSAGNTCYFNFVYEEDGVKYYPDMVKVNVCRERGIVSAIDADGYYMNHTRRTFDKPLHSLEEAAAKLNVNLSVVSASEAVIPVGNGKEKAAYEFIGEYEGEIYYVYIDARTLKQADIFKVVETDEGRLLV